jgi:hypothetical protein
LWNVCSIYSQLPFMSGGRLHPQSAHAQHRNKRRNLPIVSPESSSVPLLVAGLLRWKAADTLELWECIGKWRTYRVALERWQQGMNSDNILLHDNLLFTIPQYSYNVIQYRLFEVTILSQTRRQLDGGLSKTIRTATLVMAREVVGHEHGLPLLRECSRVMMNFRVSLWTSSMELSTTREIPSCLATR